MGIDFRLIRKTSSLQPPVSRLLAALGAVEAGEAGSEITAPEEGADGGDGIGAHDLTSSMQNGFAKQESRSTRRRIARGARRAGGAGGGSRACLPQGKRI